MKEGKLKITPFILAAVLILLALAAELVYLGDFEYRFRTKRFNRVLREKEQIMARSLEAMKPVVESGVAHGSETENNIFATAHENGITILEYFGDRLVSWSDTEFEAPRTLVDSIYTRPFVFLQNGWFLTRSVRAGSELIIGLLRIRSDYGLENDIIKNGFAKDFRIPAGTGFSRSRDASGYQIFSSDGTFLFSLLYPSEKIRTNLILIPLSLWALAFLAIIYLALCLSRCLAFRQREIQAMAVPFIIFLAVYLFVLLLKKPLVLFQTDLFSPYRYTMNGFIPSLGHLLIFAIMISVQAHIVYTVLKRSDRFFETDRTKWFTLSLLLIPGALLLSLYHIVFSHLIFDSTINFETFRVLELDIFSLTGFVIILLLFCVPFLYLLKVFRAKKLPGAPTVILSVLTASVVFPVIFMKDPLIVLSAFLLFLTVTTLIWLLRTKDTALFNKTVIFSLVLGLYSLFLITYLSDKKSEENIKIQLLAYSTENDPTAEHLLLDMWPVIVSDSTLRKMMDVSVFGKDDFDNILEYLHEEYFNGYWGSYDLSIVLCHRNDSLSVGIQNRIYEDCYGFFGEKIQTSGHRLTGTDFYFIDSKQGRASYLGRLLYEFEDSIRKWSFH